MMGRLRALADALRGRRTPRDPKLREELAYWTQAKAREGALDRSHYEPTYTTVLGLDRTFYEGKRILDAGCGPRGSLEWATMAAERVGLDPLARAYQRLGVSRHAMRYINAPVERMPIDDARFDVVCCFNMLGHVDDPDRAISEMTRVLAPGGHLLLVTDLNHPTSVTEPHAFSWDIITRFKPPLRVSWERHLEASAPSLYRCLEVAEPYDHERPETRRGILLARLHKPS